jgi:fructokinase
MKVLGIGNAIVDVICKVEESFLSENNLAKSTMKLVDETEFKKLLSNLNIEETMAGGSVANSIVGLSQLGNPVSFIGKVNNDELGDKYEKSLVSEKVKYCYQKKEETIPTGTCLILITPDSERTMCTFLGIAGKVSDKDIDENAVKNSELVFLEGYLWDEGEPRNAFNKAINVSKKTAMTLSDKFCVDRHKKSFLDLVNNKLDITFANELEILSLIDAKNFDEVISFSKQIGKLIVITRSEKGSLAIQKNKVIECDSKKDLKIVDLTGAGDLFAAGFLHGYVNKLSIKESLEKGNEMASKIIQKIGARLN